MASLTIPATALFLMGWMMPFAGAAQVVVFGPSKYIRLPGPPNQFHDTFFAPGNPEPGWFLEVWNGNAGGNNRISAATIFVNGISVLPSDFNQNMPYVREDVTDLIHPSNAIDIELRGAPAGFLTVQVTSGCSNLVLMAQKDPTGNDVELSWSGGCCVGGGCTVQYDLWKSITPTMSVVPTNFLTNDASLNYTDFGAVNDGVQLWFYIAADQTKPPIAIINPAPGSTAGGSYIPVDGTQTGAGTVYVNDVPASLGSGTFDIPQPPGVPVGQGSTPITAVAREPGDWANASVATSFVFGGVVNIPPIIDILLTTACAVNVPADGADINTRRPLVTIQYSDPDPTPQLDLSTLRVFINGDDRTAAFAPPCPSPCSFQLTAAGPLHEGVNTIVASIGDNDPSGSGNPGSANSTVAVFTVSPPSIASLTPDNAVVGGSITIAGGNFDPTFPNNIVRFNGTKAASAAGGSCTDLIGVAVPPGAFSGPVTIETDCLTPPDQDCLKSNGFNFRLTITESIAGINSIDVFPVALPNVLVYFTAANTLYSWDGSTVTTEGSLTPVTGMVGAPYDANGNIYVGRSGTSGEVHRWDGSVFAFEGNTLVSGESDAKVAGISTNRGAPGALDIHTIDDLNGKVKYLAPGSGQAVTLASNILMSPVPAGIVDPEFPATDVYFFSLSTGGTTFWSVPSGVGPETGLGMVPGGPRGSNRSIDDLLITARQGLSARAVTVVDHNKPCGGPTATCTSNLFDLGKIGSWSSTNRIRPLAVDDGCLPGGAEPSGTHCSVGSSPGVIVADQYRTTGATRLYFMPPPTASMVAVRNGVDEPVPTKVFADFDWDNQVDAPNQQSIELKVTLSPTTLMPNNAQAPYAAKVIWTVADPDSVFDGAVDPSPAGNDNASCPSRVGTNCTLGDVTKQWVDVAGFEFGTADDNETAIIGGVSHIKLNLPDHPGDNVLVTASILVPTYGVLEAKSPVINIWKKLHVEADTMGKPIGPFTADDLPPDTGFIHAPDLSLVAQAFRPAFLEVVFDTGQDNFDVPFKYDVTPGPGYLSKQGAKGRGSVSSTGYWAVYAQGAYDIKDSAVMIETDPLTVFRDSDPDENEEPVGPGDYKTPGGVTDLIGGRYALIFEEAMRDSITPEATGIQTLDISYFRAWLYAHEFGHELGLRHPSGGGPGLMNLGAVSRDLTLSPQDIITIQELTFPGHR